jgi:hypothetical protein
MARKETDQERRIREDAERRRTERTQNALNEAARNEQRVNAWSNDVFNQEIQQIFGATFEQMRATYDDTKDEKGEVKKILDRAAKAKKGKRVKILKQNKGKIKKATKSSGCAVAAMFMLSAVVGITEGIRYVV